MGTKLYIPTVGEVIDELSKHDPKSRIWVEMVGSSRVTPIKSVDGGEYSLEVQDGSWEKTVYLEFKQC